MPVGFVGVAESKRRLAASGLAHIGLRGSKGGAALVAASGGQADASLDGLGAAADAAPQGLAAARRPDSQPLPRAGGP
jgi:hypothetical protein